MNNSHDLIDQVSAINGDARAKNLRIISVHNLPRINIVQSSSMDSSSDAEQNVGNAVDQSSGGAVVPDTQSHQMNAAIVPDKSHDKRSHQEEILGYSHNMDNEQSSFFDNSIDTITSVDFHELLLDLETNALEDSDLQVISDANIKSNFSDCKKFHDIQDAISKEKTFSNIEWTNTIELLLNDEKMFDQKRNNISSSTANDGNEAKKQKLNEDATVAKKFKCKFCECQSNKKYNLQRHIRKHKPYQCDICRNRFVEKTELAAHMEEIHASQTNLG